MQNLAVKHVSSLAAYCQGLSFPPQLQVVSSRHRTDVQTDPSHFVAAAIIIEQPVSLTDKRVY